MTDDAAEPPLASINPQELQREFVFLGEKIGKLAQMRQQLVAQLNENEGVKAEFDLLSDDSELYRSLGPALLRIDKVEAKTLVEGRLERIKGDLKKLEGQVETVGTKRLEIQREMQAYQQRVMAMQQQSQQQSSSSSVGGKVASKVLG